MNLIDQIIEAALDDAQSIGNLLRKCLLLAHRMKIDELAQWAENELDGYSNQEKESLPEYRIITASAKGLMVAGFGRTINDQPIPSFILQPEHRHWAETVYLTQPIASYDMRGKPKGRGKLVLEWPADLTAMYQSKVIQGYALNRAYQEIPESSIVGLLDTIRNRVLKLVLKLKDQPIADDGEKPEAIPKETARQFVTNIIYGGQNVIGSTTRDIQQLGDINVSQGDLPGLRDFLSRAGVTSDDAKALETALAADAQDTGGQLQIGNRVRSWLGGLSGKSLKIGGEVGIGIITAAICKYLGVA